MGFELENVQRAVRQRASGSFTLKDVNEEIDRRSDDTVDDTISEISGVDGIIKDSDSGIFAALSSSQGTAANIFMLMDNAAESIAETTGTDKGGAFKKIEDYFRRKSEESGLRARTAAVGRESFGSDVVRVIAGLPVSLPTAALALLVIKNPAIALGALGGLSVADQDRDTIVKSTIAGFLVGAAFPATGALGPVARGTIIGGTASTAELGIVGGSGREAALSGLTTGVLGALGAGRGSRQGRAKIKAEEFEAARTARVVKSIDGEPPGGVKPRLKLKLQEERPLIEITDRTRALARKALEGVDGSDALGVELKDGRVFNLNLRRIDGPEAFKELQVRLVKEMEPSIQEARRGQITLAETEAMARDLGMTVEQLMNRRSGKAFNAEEITAARVLHQSIAQHMTSLATRIRLGKAGDVEKADFLKTIKMFEASTEQILGATAEAGRAMSALRISAKASNAKEVREALAQFKSHTKGASVEEFADLIGRMKTPGELTNAVRSLSATRVDMALEAWINGLLSGPQTHVVNTVSNTLVSLWSIPETFVKAGSGAVRSGLSKARGKGPVERVYFREGLARAYGFVEGSKEGLALWAKALKTGEPSDSFTKLDLGQHNAIPGLTGKVIRTPGRLLMSADEFFKAIGYRQEINSQSVRIALSEGKTGKEFHQRAAELRNMPTKAMRDAAIESARVQTFTNQLGDFGRSIIHLRDAHPMMTVIMPFVRTPTNIFKFSAQRSPLGLLFKDVKANLRKGGTARDTEIGKMAFGTAVGVASLSWAAEGRITGSGPGDPKLRKVWLAANYRPYSWLAGSDYVSYARLEPLSTILGVSADIAAISGHLDDEEAKELAGRLFLSIRKNIENKTFVKGFTELALAMADPTRYGSDWASGLAASAVPAALAQASRAMDPILRDADTIIERVKARTPGFSKTLPSELNIWGETIFMDGGVGPDFISPFYVHRFAEDPISEEVLRVKAKLSEPSDEFRRLKLTREEHHALLQLSGRLSKTVIGKMIQSDLYRRLPVGLQRKMIELARDKSVDVSRSAFIGTIMKEDPGRVQEIIDSVLKEFLE